MSQTTHLTFVQTALGLEPLLSTELRGLLPHVTPPSLSEGGVLVRLSIVDLWTTCLGSRLAEGVRVRLTDGPSLHLVVNDQLPGATLELEPNAPLRIRAWAHAPHAAVLRVWIGRS